MNFTPKAAFTALRAGLCLTLAALLSSLIPSHPASGQSQVIQKIEVLVNDEVISGYDVGQRMGLVLLATGQTIESQEQLMQLRSQVLSALVDETLQDQEAREYEVPVPDEEIFETYSRVAQSYNRTSETFGDLLDEYGSSPQAIMSQIRSEFAWQSLVNGRYGPHAEATDEEVDEILEEMRNNAGMQEYRLSEIFLIISNPSQDDQVAATAQQIRNQISGFEQFPRVARQFSQSTSAAQGGDVGWVSAGQFPDEILAVVETMDILSVSAPIKTVGGYYIVSLTDRRTILTTEPLDELLNLRQVGYFFTEETTEESALAWFEMAIARTRDFTTCANMSEFIAGLGAVNYRELGEVSLKQLNPELRVILQTVRTNQVTEPINTPDGFIIFAVCGRRMPTATLPSPEEVQNQIEQQRIAMIARRYLRDLRRDAIIDYK